MPRAEENGKLQSGAEVNRILFERGEVGPDGRVTFGGVRAAHVVDVLHGEPGQTIKTGVVGGNVGTSVIERIDGKGESLSMTVLASHDSPPLQPWCDMLLAMPRPRVFKRLVPQLAAMGVGKIVLVGAEKVEKCYWSAGCLDEAEYRPLLVEGLMQAGTSMLPELRVEKSFRRYMESRFEDEFAGSPMRFLAHPDRSAAVPQPSSASGRWLVAVGPEGGWTDAELSMLDARGFRRISLGPRILKTETAAVALLAVLGVQAQGAAQ